VAVDYVGAMLAPCYAGSCHGAGLSVSARTRGSQGRARALLGAKAQRPRRASLL